MCSTIATFTTSSVLVLFSFVASFCFISWYSNTSITCELNPCSLLGFVRVSKAFSNTSNALCLGPLPWKPSTAAAFKNGTREGTSFLTSTDGPYTKQKQKINTVLIFYLHSTHTNHMTKWQLHTHSVKRDLPGEHCLGQLSVKIIP